MTDINDELNTIQDLEAEAAELNARADQEETHADENVESALRRLDDLIKIYEAEPQHEDLLNQICAEIRRLMPIYESLQERYPNYYNLCAL